MLDEEISEIDWFVSDVYEVVGAQTNFKAYDDMSEESKRKWREKLTIMICREYSPRKNYDISKDEVRAMVVDAIEYWTEPVDE